MTPGGKKWTCRGVKGFIGSRKYARLKPSQKRQCRVYVSRGRPRIWKPRERIRRRKR